MKGQTNHGILNAGLQKALRKNMTDAERYLWQRLRNKQLEGCKFRRQHPFMNFVLDFVCIEKALVIELDGGQHLNSEQDKDRDQQLQMAGFQALRFWNNQVLQETDAVLDSIRLALNKPSH